MVKKADPWFEIKTMREEMDKIMNETMNWEQGVKKSFGRVALWQPVTDLYETEAHLVIEMEVPGVIQENVSLEVQGNQLMIHGEKRQEKEVSGSIYQILERSYGPFSRIFTLPDHIDTSLIKAVLRSGVLSITIPKTERSRTRINVEITGY